jgi:hypothetical protein
VHSSGSGTILHRVPVCRHSMAVECRRPRELDGGRPMRARILTPMSTLCLSKLGSLWNLIWR